MSQVARSLGHPPTHNLYAKLVLHRNGKKEYLPANDYDRELYNEAAQHLASRTDAFPVVEIQPGYNTNQALNYGYSYWHQMFNDRQLLSLSILADRIRQVPEQNLRELFTCLFSGTLEFNNMFTSFKGEGTGAVRHMFSHHILKPERTPLEANLWGVKNSSGAFSTLFKSRLLRAIDYCQNPFEIKVEKKDGRRSSKKVFGLSSSLGHSVVGTYHAFTDEESLYVSCGDSSNTDLDAQSVDAVITDPPFFDNVHYSELADFFYIWQEFMLGEKRELECEMTTRSPQEVQQSDAVVFSEKLRGVFAECHRVLKSEGLLVFTYHHSRSEGWQSVLEAIVKAGFWIVAAHPIKSEMSISQPKHQAKEPIDLDVIIVCRKRTNCGERQQYDDDSFEAASMEATEQISRLNNVGRRLSYNDVRVVLMANIIKRKSWTETDNSQHSITVQTAIEETIERIHQSQNGDTSVNTQEAQLTLI